MGRDCSLCIPGWNGPWWTSRRLERGWFCSPQACKQEDVVEQEHLPAGMQKLCSQQAGDPKKPSAQGKSPQMSMAKSCLGVCLGPELWLASCRMIEGIPSHNGGQGSWVPGGAARVGMHCRQLQASQAKPLLIHSCGFRDPCAPGAAASPRVQSRA